MAILFNEHTRVFILQTESSSYQMQVGAYGVLLHLYYGRRVPDGLEYLVHGMDRGFCGNPYEAGKDRTFSLDTLPQEYPSFGVGDFRTPCCAVIHEDGSNAVDFRYESYRIEKGKPAIPGLPAIYAGESEAETLVIQLKDAASGVEAELFYTVLEEYDIITRHVRIINHSKTAVRVARALSCCLDFPHNRYDMISFYGRHAMERQLERTPLRHSKIVVDSVRGASSHQQNPFVILCEPEAGEDFGECYGACMVYSGNFTAIAEVDQINQTRLTMGINPDTFQYLLEPGEAFIAPEVALCFSGEGFGRLSNNYHRLFRRRLCRGKYRDARRPVLINNWEGTYFNFDDDKLVAIAKDAAELGVEMLVMDDGWFGKRNDDMSGLGVWFVNEKKLRGGLRSLCDRVNALGMKLGIWFEPEMVSEDSELFRTHPDWCLHTPGRPGNRSRYQFVLDLSRQDVQEYLYQSVAAVLNSAPIEYVKWDMNRHLTNVWSAELPPQRQGELYHRYLLGVYSLLERLTAAFPNVLFEGCSGGGGRFDAGMLYYTPQIWCSDDTDPIERIKIQYGTSFCYPISSVGAHVSASPNHQTGRATPLGTRAVVAMAGTFGYELDINRMTAEEKDEIRDQIAFYKKHWGLINNGDYYRLSNPFTNDEWAAWQFVSQDGAQALVSFVQLRPQANAPFVTLRLKGLHPGKTYRVDGEERRYSGSALMHAGLPMPTAFGEYQAYQFVLTEV